MVSGRAVISAQAVARLVARSAATLPAPTNAQAIVRLAVITPSMTVVNRQYRLVASVPQAVIGQTNPYAPIVALHRANPHRDQPQHLRPCLYATAYKPSAPQR